MNVVAAARSAIQVITGKSASPYGGLSLGSGLSFVDAFNKNPSPNAYGLIREFVSTAYACANLNAALVAKTHLRLYVKNRRGEGKGWCARRGDTRALGTKQLAHVQKVARNRTANAVEIEEVVSHPILDLLNNPTQSSDEDGVGISAYELFELTQLFLEVVGRCYWWADQSGPGGTPSSIWIMLPQLTTPVRGSSGGPIVSKYLFSGGGSKTEYDPSEIIPFRMPDLMDPLTGGMSPLRACFEEIRIVRKANALTNATLDNGGKPSAVFTPLPDPLVGGGLDENAVKRMTAKFSAAFARARAGGILVADVPGSIEPLSWPMNEIIDAVRMGMTKTAVCNAFQVPDTKLNRNAANLASARTGDYAHAADAGLPRLRRNEAALNQFLVPMWGPEAKERLFLAYDDPEELRDPITEAEMSRAAAIRGSITRNEDRDALGLPPVPWGDQPTIDRNQVAVDPKTGQPLAPPVAQTAGGDTGDDTDDSDDSDDEEKQVDRLRKVVGEVISPEIKALRGRIGNLDKRSRSMSKRINAIGKQQTVLDAGRGNDGASDAGAARTGGESGQVGADGERVHDHVDPGGATESIKLLAEAAREYLAKAGCGGNTEARTAAVDTAKADPDHAEIPPVINQTEDGLARPLPQGEEMAAALVRVFEHQRDQMLLAIAQDKKAAPPPDGDKPGPSGMPSANLPFLPSLSTQSALAYVAESVKPSFEIIASKEGAKLLHTVDASRDAFSVFEKNIPEAAQKMSIKLAESINQTTDKEISEAVQQLRDEISEGLIEGDGRRELTHRVQLVFENATKQRAQTIARTEASRAVHRGEKIAAKASNVVKTKSWLASADACDQCLEYAAQGPIPIDQLFDDSDEEYPVDTAPGHPCCQCSMLWGVKDLSQQ